jgi:hypothetical protein
MPEVGPEILPALIPAVLPPFLLLPDQTMTVAG